MPQLIDLSYPIQPHWRWAVEVERVKAHERGDVFQSSIARLSARMPAYHHWVSSASYIRRYSPGFTPFPRRR